MKSDFHSGLVPSSLNEVYILRTGIFSSIRMTSILSDSNSFFRRAISSLTAKTAF